MRNVKKAIRNAMLFLGVIGVLGTAGCALPGDADQTPAAVSVTPDAALSIPTPELLEPTPDPALTPPDALDAGITDGTDASGAPIDGVDAGANAGLDAGADAQGTESLDSAPAPPGSTGGPVTFPAAGYCNGEGVNLRAEPDTNASIVDIMGENAALEVLSQEGEWYSVKAGDQSAYVSAALVTIGTPPRKDNMRWAKVIEDKVQAYGAPTDTDVLDTILNKNDTLKVLRTLDGYVHVVYDKSIQCYVKEASVEYITKQEYDEALAGG